MNRLIKNIVITINGRLIDNINNYKSVLKTLTKPENYSNAPIAVSDHSSDSDHEKAGLIQMSQSITKHVYKYSQHK